MSKITDQDEFDAHLARLEKVKGMFVNRTFFKPFETSKESLTTIRDYCDQVDNSDEVVEQATQSTSKRKASQAFELVQFQDIDLAQCNMVNNVP